MHCNNTGIKKRGIALRRGILALAVLMLLSGLVCCASAEGSGAEERVFVATADWVPPEIDAEEALRNEPWMLAVKIAQEEIGFVEGPGYNASKYGEWFGNRYSAWCSEFVTWCVNTADERYGSSLMETVFPYCGRCKDGSNWFLQRDRFIAKTGKVPVSGERMWMTGADRYLEKGEYIPYPGDYM